MATELKSIRVTLQESLEDDTTGKGSNSRLILLISTLLFATGLILTLCVHCFMGQKLESLINSFIIALCGTVIPYATNVVAKAIVTSRTSPPQS